MYEIMMLQVFAISNKNGLSVLLVLKKKNSHTYRNESSTFLHEKL
jgi:hypothetical protein